MLHSVQGGGEGGEILICTGIFHLTECDTEISNLEWGILKGKRLTI